MNANAAQLDRPLYRPVLSETDGLVAFQPLPEGLQIAGTPLDYLRLTQNGDGTVNFIPMLFGGTNEFKSEYEELTSRMLFALHTQFDGRWGSISLRAFLKAIVVESRERAAERSWQSTTAEYVTEVAKTESGQNDVSLLRRIRNALHNDNPVPAQPEPITDLAQPKYRFMPSVLMLGTNVQQSTNDYLKLMFGEELIGTDTTGEYFYPTLKLTRAINKHFNPNIPA